MEGPLALESQPVALYSPEFFADPYGYYGHLREAAPVYWHDKHEMWIVTRFEDVNRVARDPVTYSSELAQRDRRTPPVAVRSDDLPLVEETNAVHVHELIQMDPPLHTKKRRAVNARFLPSAIKSWRPLVMRVLAELLDRLDPTATVDVVSAIGAPLPLAVVSRMMGIPEANVEMIAEQARKRMAAVLSVEDDRFAVSVEGFRETSEYLDRLLDERHRGGVGVDDVLGDLVAAEADGSYTRAESLANAMMILDAGHETTIQLICNGTLMLLRHPEQWDALVAEPRRLAPSVVTECLRFDPPLHVLRRIATRDVEIGPELIRAGERVLAVVSAANRDPRRFADPDRFDIHRPAGQNLSFGAGAHLCLGQHLARIEGEEYFAALAGRFPAARLALDGPPRYNRTPAVRSLASLSVTLG